MSFSPTPSTTQTMSSDLSARVTSALGDSYRIERELGRGGMAIVYLAHDLKHERKVALKVLKPELAAVLGAERFLVEIKTTASLQHPHILPLFDSGTAGGLLYYVMPFIEGETLRAQLTRETQLGIDEAVRIATQVADALDYAHRRGVIHRDIKPENILLHDGRPMVADFGIALAVSAAAGGRMTETGLSLGTPHYMSPEQATAEKEITGRSDVYSLGSVLYEMLAGEPPHTGNSAQQIIMKIITEEAPAVTRHRKSVPVNVAAAVAISLEKLPADRFVSARAFAEALADPGFRQTTSRAAESRHVSWRWNQWAVGLGSVALLATTLAAWAWFRPRSTPEGPLARFSLSYPSDASIQDEHGSPVALTPDGRSVVSVGRQQLYLRRLDQIDAVPIPNTADGAQPFFSPDGLSLGFYAQGKLKRVGLDGGPAATICQVAGIMRGASWGAGDVIVFSTDSVLLQVPATGGVPEAVARPDSTRGELAYRWPSFLPAGRRVLLTVWKGTNDNAAIGVIDLSSRHVSSITDGGTSPRFVEPGWLAYAKGDGTVFAAPFDLRAARVTGTARPVFENVRVGAAGAAKLGLSSRGWAAYLRRSGVAQLVLVDRQGAARAVPGEARPFNAPRFSPDGRKVAVSVSPPGPTGDIWVVDPQQGTQSRLTFEGDNRYPEWSPDGGRVLFASKRRGPFALFWTLGVGGGTAESLLAKADRSIHEGLLANGARTLVYREGAEPSADVYYKPVGTGESRPFLTSAFNERAPTLSPNGRWLAYVSDESGQDEVHVRPFPEGSGRWQVSPAMGREPRWAPDGRELFYRKADTLIAVAVRTESAFSVVGWAPLFTGHYLSSTGHADYDVHPDGRHFIFVAVSAGSQDLVFVQNVFSSGPRPPTGAGRR